jgi:hypothetical protein
MKKILLLTAITTLVLTNPNAFGQSYLVNIDIFSSNDVFSNSTAASAYSGAGVIGNSGDFWNGVDWNNIPRSANNLKTASGSTTGISVSFLAFGTYGQGAGNNNYGNIGALLDPETLLGASVSTISGLIANSQYDLYLIGANSSIGLSVNGVNYSWGQLPNGNYNSFPSSEGGYDMHTVTADANGVLSIVGSYPNSWISALQLTPSPTPEPSTLALASLGAVSMLAFRRRK